MGVEGKWLLKIQLLRLTGVNQYRKGKKGDKRDQGLVVLLVFTFLGLFYSGMISIGLMVAGGDTILMPLMAGISGAIAFFFSVTQSVSHLYGGRDYEFLLSLPIRMPVLVASRMIPLYIQNLWIHMVVLLPAGIVYSLMGIPAMWFWPSFFLSLFFLPLVPLALGMGVGAFFAFLSSRFRHKNLFQTILVFALLLGILAFSFQSKEMEGEELKELAGGFYRVLRQLNPLLILYRKALLYNAWWALLLLLVLSLGVGAGISWLIGKNFVTINSKLAAKEHHRKMILKKEAPTSAFFALYRKEAKTFFSSTIYVTNVGVGCLFVIAGGIYACVKFAQIKGSLEPQEWYFIQAVADRFIPIGISFLLATSCSTASALSMEGKHLWILLSAPLSAKVIYQSKIALNLTLTVPAALIGGILFTVATGAGPVQLLCNTLVPLLFAGFFAVLGMEINRLFPKYLWEREAQVIKNSLASGIGILGGMVISGVTGALLLGLSFWPIWLEYLIIALIVGISGGAIYLHLMKKPIPRGE